MIIETGNTIDPLHDKKQEAVDPERAK